MIRIMLDALAPHFAKLSFEERGFKAGDRLFQRDQMVCCLHYIMDGLVHLVRYQRNGAQTVLQRAESGNFLAESSLFSPAYHCDGLAIANTRTRLFDRREVVAAMRSDSEFASTWAQYLSREVQRTRARAEIRSIKRLDDRLEAWLDLREGKMPPKGGWASVAHEIGVTPEALYRHLATRRAKVSRED